ncbi:MAG: ABC transporter transmembrane domain-containing protein, partial [bacterium]|nr:ABC transporter transmembrane domain-containing protein [bacterium]
MSIEAQEATTRLAEKEPFFSSEEPSHSTWFSIETDVALSGVPESHWLVVTDAFLGLSKDEAGAEIIRSVPCEEIRAVRTVVGVGSGRLQVQVGEEWQDLLRFSNSLADRFEKLARRIDTWLDDGRTEPLVADLSKLDAASCPTCQLRLEPRQDSCPRCLPRKQLLQRAASFLAPYWRGSLGLCLLTIIGVTAELIPPKLQQYMVDHLLTNAVGTQSAASIQTSLLVVVLALAVSRIVLSLVGIIKGRLATAIGSGLTCNLRKEMVNKLQNLAIAYYDRHQVGSMISRVAHDSEVLNGLMQQLTGGFLLQIVQLFGVGAMLLWLNPKLAMFTLIPVPLVFLGTWFYWRAVYPRYYRLWDASSKQISVLSGMLSGIRIVKAFGQQQREYDRFATTADRLRDWRVWTEHASSRYAATMQLVFSLGGLIVWYVGGRDVIGRDMSLGQLIAFLAYLSMFYAPLGAISNFTAWLTSFLSGSKRVFELLDTPITIQESAQPVAWTRQRGEIAFEDVSFGYDAHQPVLKNVSFQIQAGEMVGIVGRSGSGKSTMVNLLTRLYDV